MFERVVAEAVCRERHGPYPPAEVPCVVCLHNAGLSLHALATSDEVRAAIVKAPCVNFDERNSCEALPFRHPACILAAIAPEAPNA